MTASSSSCDSKESHLHHRHHHTAHTAHATHSAHPAEKHRLAEKSHRSLLHFHQLPAWMRDNEFIHSSYRPEVFSYLHCFDSLFYMHNETVNIYSHLIGAVLFAVVALSSLAFGMEHVDTMRWEDIFVLAMFLLGAVLCLGLSALFHTFSCHSEQVSASWNRCDYVGIVFLIVGSFYPAIYYCFYCSTFWKITYLTAITVLGAAAIYVCVDEAFRAAKYRTFRAIIFSALGTCGVVPFAHALYVYGWDHAVEAISLPWFLGMGFLYLSGAAIYSARIPERWFPGKFDLWMHSHQIFHFIVVMGAWLHYVGVVRTYRYHHFSDPTCENDTLISSSWAW